MLKKPTITASQAKEAIRDAGVRATAARVAVLRWLAAASKPQSHSDVVNGLGDSGFDQSTLFRCLNELADARLVVRLVLDDQVRRFELAERGDASGTGQALFVCTDCGEVTCLDDVTVEVTPRSGRSDRELGKVTELLLRGRCGACAGV